MVVVPSTTVISTETLSSVATFLVPLPPRDCGWISRHHGIVTARLTVFGPSPGGAMMSGLIRGKNMRKSLSALVFATIGTLAGARPGLGAMAGQLIELARL